MDVVSNRAEHPNRKMGDHTTPAHVFGKAAPYKPASEVYGQPHHDIYGDQVTYGGSQQGKDLTPHGKNLESQRKDSNGFWVTPKKVGKVRGMINKIRGKK